MALTDTEILIFGCLSALLIFAIIIGNVSLLIIFFSFQSVRKITNWFIVSLSLADLLVGVAIVPLSVAYKILGKWPFGSLLCEVWLAADVFLCTASILNITSIAIDRWLALRAPLAHAYRSTATRVSLMLLTAWSTSLVVALPPLLGWKHRHPPGDCLLSKNLGYVIYSTAGSFVIPVALITVVYVKIFFRTKQRSRLIKRETSQRHELMTKTFAEVSSTDASPNIEEKLPQPTDKFLGVMEYSNNYSRPSLAQYEKHSKVRMKLLEKRERQTAVMLGLIITTFVLCWFPFFTIYLLQAIGFSVNEKLFNVAFFAGYLNSSLNPVIYGWFNPEIRASFITSVSNLIRKRQNR